jgi:nitrogenase molybdenum-iron protein NifN
VTTTRSPLLERLPVAEVLIGDLEDFEHSAQAAGCDLLMTHSHGRQAAQRLGKPLFRIGIPMFDRIGNAHTSATWATAARATSSTRWATC